MQGLWVSVRVRASQWVSGWATVSGLIIELRRGLLVGLELDLVRVPVSRFLKLR